LIRAYSTVIRIFERTL